ncbi:MAG: DUF2062 domain-containing protein [Candidatus Hydrogenedentota bacterium]
MSVTTGEPRVCVLLPTYNNARTILAIVDGVRRYVSTIIVINDGCTDNTETLLNQCDGIEVVTHATNKGKGAAIVSGFVHARELNCTHVITMDTDGQHNPDEIPQFLEAIKENEKSVVIGNRKLPEGRRARKSRILRKNSNFWTWVVTGHWVEDTQSGFRSYPLESLSELHFKTTRYDFEIEVLVYAIWNDVAIESIPVSASYGPGSESHFRPIVDFLRVAHLNIRFIFERLFLAKVIRARLHTTAFRQGTISERIGRFVRTTMLQESVTPFQFAACIGVGVVCGILPVWGFQSALALSIAGLLNLSRTLTFLASNISIPIMMPVIFYLSLLTGHVMLTGNVDLPLSPKSLPDGWKTAYALEYLVGSVCFSGIAGVLSGALAFSAAHLTLKEHRGDSRDT